MSRFPMPNLDVTVNPEAKSPQSVLDSQPNLSSSAVLTPTDSFVWRHIGPSAAEIEQMLNLLGFANFDAL
ncbi:MAG TPA: hypothetical protein V6D26_31715, partial [Stenomitos sp.]